MFIWGVDVLAPELPTTQKALVGYVRDDEIRLRKWIPNFNSFQTWLFADLIEEREHTRLHCYVGLHPHVVAFMLFWLALILWLGGALGSQPREEGTLIIDFLGYHTVVQSWWVRPTMNVVLVAAGVAIVALGCFFARGEQKFLIGYVCKLLDVQDDRQARLRIR